MIRMDKSTGKKGLICISILDSSFHFYGGFFLYEILSSVRSFRSAMKIQFISSQCKQAAHGQRVGII